MFTAYKMKTAELAQPITDTIRPCGMNNLIYLASKLPSPKDINRFKKAEAGTSIVLFNEDKVQSIYYGYM